MSIKGRSTGLLDVDSLTDSQIDGLMSELLDVKLHRAIQDADPDVLVAESMQALFGPTGEPSPPKALVPGIIAVAGMVQDTSADKHNCKLWTVKLPDGSPEQWSWDDDIDTFIHGDSEKVGKLRRSVNLHVAVDGMILVQHSMAHDGSRHLRKSCSAYEVSQTHDPETGEVGTTTITRLSDWTPSHLPPPNGETDQRSYSGRQQR